MHRFVKKSTVLSLTALTLIGFVSCGFLPQEESVAEIPMVETSSITYKTKEATVGYIENAVTGNGTVMPVKQYSLTFEKRGGYLSAIYVKSGDQVKKGDVLAELDVDSLKNEIERNKLYVKKAEIYYQQTVASGASATDVQLAEIDLKLAKLQLDDLQLQLDKSTIYAPIDGEITYIADVKVGDWVNAGSGLFTLADLSDYYFTVKTGTKSTEDYNIAVGTAVTVTIGGKEYSATVAMTPDTVPEDVAKSFENCILFTFDTAPENIHSGMSGELKYVIESKDDAIIVPANAVQYYGGKHYVPVLIDGIRNENIVEIGIEGSTTTEIVSGISAGDLVIIG